MIIYIHGFASSGFGSKAKLFKESFAEDILLPSLSYIPSLALNTLEQIIELLLKRNEKVYLIGSSLGGFYCVYLANKYRLKAVLINPAIYPSKTLEKIGMQTNYYDNSIFEVKKEHLEFLKSMEIKSIHNKKDFLVLLQKEDEVLDYKEAKLFLKGSSFYIEEGGNHSFENIQKYFKTINDFLKS